MICRLTSGRAALLAATLLACATATAQAQTASATTSPSPLAKWAPWFEFGGYGGTDGSSRGEAALWVPLAQDGASLIFMDVRGKLFEEGADEANVALGYRRMLASGWNLGVWAGYDRRGTQAGSTFGQVAGGIELLSADFDIRFNGYLPTDDEKTLFDTTATFGSGVPTVELVGDQNLHNVVVHHRHLDGAGTRAARRRRRGRRAPVRRIRHGDARAARLWRRLLLRPFRSRRGDRRPQGAHGAALRRHHPGRTGLAADVRG